MRIYPIRQYTGWKVWPDLLHKHDNLGCNHRSSIPRNSDHLLKLVMRELHRQLSFEKRIHVEDIPRRLNLVISKSTHRLISIDMPVVWSSPASSCKEVSQDACSPSFVQKPSRRFRAAENEEAGDCSRNHWGSHHQSPFQSAYTWRIRNPVKCEVHSIAKHCTKSNPSAVLLAAEIAEGYR